MSKTLYQEMDYFNAYKDSKGFVTVWSMFESDIEFDQQHCFKTPLVIKNKCEVWGYDATVVCEGSTWGDIYAACDLAIRNSVDYDGNRDHHIYIEDLTCQEDGTWLISTGS
jgi:hypothetical protein